MICVDSPLSLASGRVDFEARALLSKRFIEKTVDPRTGQPYFTVFYDKPVALHHDWPDFADLLARYWEAAYMVREMTGSAPENIDQLGELLFGYFDSDGLNYRPATAYSTNSAELFDQGRTLNTLCSVYMATGSADVRCAMLKMVDALVNISEVHGGYRYMPGTRFSHGKWETRAENCGYFVGPLIRPLVKVWDLLGYQPAMDLASDFARYLVEKAEVFGPNGEFNDHVHSRMAAASGLFACGKAADNSDWVNVARNAWDYARDKAGPCGFVPEYWGGADANLRSETCAIMDYLDLTLLMASSGDQDKWGDAERIVRNHLIESQIVSSNWLYSSSEYARDDLSLCGDVPERMLGAFAGWSGFDRLFGATPRSGDAWVVNAHMRDAYTQRSRLFQNCCGPAGLRSLYMAWSQAAVFEGNELRVNMLFNRALPDASVCVSETNDKLIEVEICLDRSCGLSVRVPEWTSDDSVIVLKNGALANADIAGKRLSMSNLEAGDKVVARFPFNITQEEYVVQNSGRYEQEVFAIDFKADSAISVQRVSGGLTDEQRSVLSALPNTYPLYVRASDVVYAAESKPRKTEATMNWH
ncbi:MAG: hypothetical protein ACYC64_13930 [Armatimonadota bacterium]